MIQVEAKVQMESFDEFKFIVEEVFRKHKAINASSDDEFLYKGLVTFFFFKGWTSFQAINLLCQAGYPNDGYILARSLLEMVVDLLYISVDPMKRARLFHEYDFVLRKKRLDSLEKKKDNPWCQSIVGARPDDVRQLLHDYEAVKGNYPDKRFWSGKSRRDMAIDVNMEFQYEQIYSLLCDLSHPSPRAINSFISDRTEGFVIAQDSSREALDKVWLLARVYFLILLDKQNDVFELGLGNEIEAIHDSIIAKHSGS